MLEEFIERIKKINSMKAYDELMGELNQALSEKGYPKEFCQDIYNKQKYMKNRFSDEANREKMIAAKENVVEALLQFMNTDKEEMSGLTLIQYLQNFYIFMESLSER